MSRREEKKHHKVCFNKRLDDYLYNNAEPVYCRRCSTYFDFKMVLVGRRLGR